jgi:cytochrome P450
MLGIPLEDREKFQHWAVTLMASGGQDMEAIMSCAMYFGELFDARTKDPLDDIPSLLTGIRVEDEPITKEQFILTMVMLMSAGLDTTTNSGSHMLYWLGQHPSERRLLVDEPSRIPAAVEELLRHITPLPALFRTATRAVSLHGAEISPGDRVQLCWMSANHDPDEFPDPETLHLDRTPNRHFSFGIGTHRCLGAGWPAWSCGSCWRRRCHGWATTRSSARPPATPAPPGASATCTSPSRPVLVEQGPDPRPAALRPCVGSAASSRVLRGQ